MSLDEDEDQELTDKILVAAGKAGVQIPLYFEHQFMRAWVRNEIEEAETLVKRGFPITEDDAYLWMHLVSTIPEMSGAVTVAVTAVTAAYSYIFATEQYGLNTHVLGARIVIDPYFREMIKRASNDAQAIEDARKLCPTES